MWGEVEKSWKMLDHHPAVDGNIEILYNIMKMAAYIRYMKLNNEGFELCT